MKWSKICEQSNNSVLQLKIIKAIYEPSTPYTNPKQMIFFGSGFIIDIKRGFIITSAHIVSDAISIIGRLPKTGDMDITIELIGISREKDLALCKIKHDDLLYIIRGLTDICELNMMFDDSMNMTHGDSILTIGYPLGQSKIKYTNGIISGFESIKHQFGNAEDTISRSPTYIQITAAINPGNSGGPLLNKNGKVIGIISGGCPCTQNISYAIPSRTFLAIFHSLLKEPIVKSPTLALNWSTTNRDLMKLKTGSSSTYGIYVRSIHPDSVPNRLLEGDIIRRIEYEDPFWGSYENFDVTNENFKNTVPVSVFLDRYGMTTCIGELEDPKNVDNPELKQIFTSRKLYLSEVMDMIPINSNITFDICRDGKWYNLKTKYSYIKSDRIQHIYPHIKKVDYEIFGGIVCCNLNMSHLYKYNNLNYIMTDDKAKYKKQVVIVQIFPNTNAGKSQILKPGHLINKLNDQDVSDLEDIRRILRDHPSTLSIHTNDNSLFLIDTSTVITEDKKSIMKYNIQDFNYLL